MKEVIIEDSLNQEEKKLPEPEPEEVDLKEPDWSAIHEAQIEKDKRYKQASPGHCQVIAGHF